MKKRIVAILAVLLCFCFILNNVSMQAMADASDTGKISIGNVSCKPGDTVSVPVRLDKNPGIVSIYLSIKYDESVMKLNSITDTGLLTDYQSGDIKQNPFTLSWEMASISENNESTGELVVLNFSILEDGSAGDYDITVSEYGSGNVYDIDLNDVTFEYVAGTITIEAIEHEHQFNGKTETIKKADCINDGLIRTYCSVDNCTEYKETVIPAMGHTYDGKLEVIKGATCTENGILRKYCSFDGCSASQDEVIPATGHTFSEWKTVITPAINKDGLKKRICSVCNFEESQIIEAIVHGTSDHTYDGKQEVIKEATCIENGILRKYCSFDGCSASQDEVIPAIGHVYDDKQEIIKEATCTENGILRKYCSFDGCSASQDEVIPATGHVYDDWEIIKEAVIGATGEKERICTICNTKETQIIPAIKHDENDHIFDGKVEVIKEADCITEGLQKIYCSIDGCNKSIEKVIPALGHTYGEDVEIKKATFMQDGLMKKVCQTCQDELMTIIPKLSDSHTHDFSEKEVIIREATCTEKGLMQIKCSNPECDSIKEVELPMIVHSYGEWRTTKEAEEGVDGIKERICSVCGIKEETKIPALVISDSSENVVENKESSATVKTGDVSGGYVWFIVLGCSLILICVSVNKKRDNI